MKIPKLYLAGVIIIGIFTALAPNAFGFDRANLSSGKFVYFSSLASTGAMSTGGILNATINAGGSGYKDNDVLTVAGGIGGTVKVKTTAGKVTAISAF